MIEVSGLRKRFGAVIALEDVSAAFPAGSICGIVGPNSAGKSTLLKIILGLVHADAGEVRMDGAPLDGDLRRRGRIGFMRQIPSYPDNLNAEELFRMLRSLRPQDGVDDSLIEELRLGGELRKPFRTLSGGTLQKVNAVTAFLFQPAVLILDEPTAGLDPASSRVLKQHVRAARDSGRTVLLTSHVLSELQELADAVLLLVDGRVRFSGSPERLLAETGQAVLEDALAGMLEAT